MQFFFTAHAQGIDKDFENKEVLSAPDSLFNAGDYANALEGFLKLIEKYPKDPKINYKVGVCYLKSTRNTQKAIEYLRFASTRDVPNLVYYYLGEAFRKQYKFDDAISYYRRFTINGGDPKISSQQIERLVNQSENGNFMLRYIFRPEVIDKKRVLKTEVNQYIITKPQRGAFIPTPDDLKTPTDRKQGNNSLIFYPTNPQSGDRIVYSSYGGTTTIGKDLYMIEMHDDGIWSKPQHLGDVVNSSGYEDFAYLAPDGITLYFGSTGHYSIGGYDIYRTIYNQSVNQWSIPENLGFPFSSPYDDYLFVPNEDESLAIFVTNRGTASDSVDVVLVKMDPNPIRRSISDINKIQGIAQLKPIGKPMELNFVSDEKGESSTVKPMPTAASFSTVENDPEYSRALTIGFQEQMKADSLKIRLDGLRERFDFIYTAEDRRNLEQRVVAVEDALLTAQRNADIQFARASQIEQEYLTGVRKPIEKPTSTFATDNPDFLYQAQFASTVFQSSELEQLARLERQASRINSQREEVLSLREKVRKVEQDTIQNFETQKTNYNNRLRSFNTLLSGYVSGKKKLYNECISVALMKRGAGNDQPIRREINRANGHFRAATAIRNNATDDTKLESEFEALLLEKLGVLRLEVAFAKIWDMRLFEQQMLSKVYQLEHSIFGRRLPDEPLAQTTDSEYQRQQAVKPTISITRIDSQLETTETFAFEAEREPAFEVLDKSDYNADAPIHPHDIKVDGVVYKIQVAAFSNPQSFDFFKGMSPVSAEPVNNGRITKYYIGNFNFLDDAEKALPTVRSKGFRDAFIVAWHDGRSVAPSRAKALEQTMPQQQQQRVRIETQPDDKLYIIQLGTYVGRLPEDVTQTIRALAPDRDVVRKPDGKGGFVYSIGSYTDAAEANRVKDNLIAGGIKNAFVVAVDVDN